jgi:hypothetical protein
VADTGYQRWVAICEVHTGPGPNTGHALIPVCRGGNRADRVGSGRVGFGFGSGQFDLLEEKSDRSGSGQFICRVFSDR